MEIFVSSVLLSHRNPSGMLSWEISGILDNLSIFQNSINEQIPAQSQQEVQALIECLYCWCRTCICTLGCLDGRLSAKILLTKQRSDNSLNQRRTVYIKYFLPSKEGSWLVDSSSWTAVYTRITMQDVALMH